MLKQFLTIVLTSMCVLGGSCWGWAQVPGMGTLDTGSVGSGINLGLNPGLVGGGAAMPGAIALKITGEVKCVGCTLEEMGLEDSPGDLYQFSQKTTHMVIQVIKGSPEMAWELVEGNKLFLVPGEDPAQLQRLLSESKPGTRLEVTGGVAPGMKVFVPLFVHMK